MRLLFDDGNWFFNVNYNEVSVKFVKGYAYNDGYGHETKTSRLYVNDALVIMTDVKNSKLLEQLYLYICRLDEEKVIWININAEWNDILKKEEVES